MKSPVAITSPDRASIASSADFLAYVDTQRTDAQRRRDDHQAKIEARRTAKARAKVDHDRAMIEFDADIADLTALVADEQSIIDAAERALSMERPAPKLEPSTVVRDELEQQQ